MNLNGFSHISRHVIAYSLLGIFILWWILRLHPFGAAFSPDSVYYLIAATYFNAGHGVSIPYYALDGQVTYQAVTTWPPLYPLVLSLFLSPELSSPYAASLLTLVLMMVSAGLLLHIMTKNVGLYSGFICVFIFLLATPIQIVFSFAWNESLAITLLLLANIVWMRLLVAAKNSTIKVEMSYAILFALILASIFWTRYVGLIFFCLIPLAWYFSAKRRILPYVIAAGVYGVLVGMLLLHNHTVTGHLMGLDATKANALRVGAQQTFLENSWDFIQASLMLFPTSIYAYFLMGCAMFVVFRWHCSVDSVAASPHNLDMQKVRDLWIFQIAVIGLYVFGLIGLRSFIEFEEIRVRYVSVIIPALLCCFALIGYWSYEQRGQSRFAAGVGSLILGLLILIVWEGIRLHQSAVTNLVKNGSAEFLMSRKNNEDYYANYNYPLQSNILRQIFYQLDPQQEKLWLVSNPAFAAFITQRPLAQFREFPDALTAENIVKINRYLSGGFVVLTEHSDMQAVGDYYTREKIEPFILKDYLKYNLFILSLPLPE